MWFCSIPKTVEKFQKVEHFFPAFANFVFNVVSFIPFFNSPSSIRFELVDTIFIVSVIVIVVSVFLASFTELRSGHST